MFYLHASVLSHTFLGGFMMASQFLIAFPSMQPVAFCVCRVYPKYWLKYGVYPDFHSCFIGDIQHSTGPENATNFPGYQRHVWGPCEPSDHFTYRMIKYCHLVKASQESLRNWRMQQSQAESMDRKSETVSLSETTAALPSRMGTPGNPACCGKGSPIPAAFGTGCSEAPHSPGLLTSPLGSVLSPVWGSVSSSYWWPPFVLSAFLSPHIRFLSIQQLLLCIWNYNTAALPPLMHLVYKQQIVF